MKDYSSPSFSAVRSLLFATLGGIACLSASSAGGQSPDLELETGDEGFTVRIGDRVLAEYRFATDRGPVFYPVYAPGGQPLTRGYPMEEIDGESRDHPHHRSLWIAYGNANGHDFWHGDDKIRHRHFETIDDDASGPAVRVRNDWISGAGETICTDERVYRFSSPNDDLWILDIDFSITASHGDLTLHDDKEGFLAVRVAPGLRVRGGEGSILNSEGDRDGDAWSKRAKWCSYFGPLEGETVGITIFDHPENLRHPSWWHVREYGLFAMNPFGMHEFAGAPEGSGDVAIPGGESLRFQYRLIFHQGSPEEIDVDTLYKDFAETE